jgi:hypothetical protein
MPVGIPPQKYFDVRPNVRFLNWSTGEIGVTGELVKMKRSSLIPSSIWVLYLEPKVYRLQVTTYYAYKHYEEIPV